MIAGLRINKRNRYQCEFCAHTSWKQLAAAERHVLNLHPVEHENAELKRKINRLETKPPVIKTVEKEKIVYRDPPKPKYWYQSVYCDTCKVVIQNAGIPNGQSIENTPHGTCGTRALKIVVAFQ